MTTQPKKDKQTKPRVRSRAAMAVFVPRDESRTNSQLDASKAPATTLATVLTEGVLQAASYIIWLNGEGGQIECEGSQTFPLYKENIDMHWDPSQPSPSKCIVNAGGVQVDLLNNLVLTSFGGLPTNQPRQEWEKFTCVEGPIEDRRSYTIRHGVPVDSLLVDGGLIFEGEVVAPDLIRGTPMSVLLRHWNYMGYNIEAKTKEGFVEDIKWRVQAIMKSRPMNANQYKSGSNSLMPTFDLTTTSETMSVVLGERKVGPNGQRLSTRFIAALVGKLTEGSDHPLERGWAHGNEWLAQLARKDVIERPRWRF